MGYGEYEKYVKNTYLDYDEKIIELSSAAIQMFKDIVTEIKTILNCNTEIINGDLEGINGDDSCVNGINVNHGEFIVIDNMMIDDAYNFKLVDSLKETICHEIAHNKHWNHSRWHKALTREYFDRVTA